MVLGLLGLSGLVPVYLLPFFSSSVPLFSVRPSSGPLPTCPINEGIVLGRVTLLPSFIDLTACPFSYTVHVVSYRFSFSSSLSEM